MAEIKLLPCPFCGKAAKIREADDGTEIYCPGPYTKCLACPSLTHIDPDYAVKMWNRRKGGS